MVVVLRFGKMMSIFLLIFCLTMFLPALASAESTVWVSPTYNFKEAKIIWVKPPSFSYEYTGFNLNNEKNRTVNYPQAEAKVDTILNDTTKKAKERLFVFEKTLAQPHEKTIFEIDDEKYANLILKVKVMDFGWFYEYYPPYTSWETVTTYEKYRDLDSKGKVIHEGTREIRRQVPVHHPAGYRIADSAAAEFLLIDSQTNQVVWKYSDKRHRHSGDSATSYDKSGPASMLKRIFEAAFNNMPFK